MSQRAHDNAACPASHVSRNHYTLALTRHWTVHQSIPHSQSVITSLWSDIMPLLPCCSPFQAQAATEPEDESAAIDDGSTIKAKREHRRQPSCVEAPEEIQAKFSGTAKRLPPAQAAMVYLRSGGVVLGLGSAFIFAFTQTTRIIGDWWIR